MPIIEEFIENNDEREERLNVLHSRSSLQQSDQQLAIDWLVRHNFESIQNFESINLELSEAIQILKSLNSRHVKTAYKRSIFNFLCGLVGINFRFCCDEHGHIGVFDNVQFLLNHFSFIGAILQCYGHYLQNKLRSSITHPLFDKHPMIDRTQCDIFEIFHGRMTQENLALARQVAMEEYNFGCAKAAGALSKSLFFTDNIELILNNIAIILLICSLLFQLIRNLAKQFYNLRLNTFINLTPTESIRIINSADKFNINVKGFELPSLLAAFKLKKTLVEAHYERLCKKLILSEVFEKKYLPTIINVILDYSDEYEIAKPRTMLKTALLSSLNKRNSKLPLKFQIISRGNDDCVIHVSCFNSYIVALTFKIQNFVEVSLFTNANLSHLMRVKLNDIFENVSKDKEIKEIILEFANKEIRQNYRQNRVPQTIRITTHALLVNEDRNFYDVTLIITNFIPLDIRYVIQLNSQIELTGLLEPKLSASHYQKICDKINTSLRMGFTPDNLSNEDTETIYRHANDLHWISTNCHAHRFFQRLKTDSNSDIPIYRYNTQQVLKHILDYAEDDTAKRLTMRK